MARRTSAWCMGLYVETPHGKSSRPVAWLCMTKFDRELWETRSGWRLLDEKWRLALGRLWHAWCWHFAPDIIQGSCAKRARKRAKRAQKGAKRARKKSVPLDPLVLTVMTCRVFLKTLFTHGPNRRHGPKRRRRHVVLSLWGACCSLSLASSSIAPFSSWNGFISVLLGLPVRMFLDFAACSVHLIYVMYLFVVTVVFLCWMLNVARPAWGFLVWKKYPTVDVVLWKLRYSWRLFAGGILAYEKHTWCWGGYFRFTLSKARLFTCAAMQPMLSGVAVRGRIWHAAHALARDKSVLSSLWGKNQVDYYGEPRNFGHLFFSDP